jgi:DNA mismatch endonuclease (patch repair protein)
MIRRILRDLVVGYLIHRKDLPGKPDISMVGRKRIIEVIGCFFLRNFHEL